MKTRTTNHRRPELAALGVVPRRQQGQALIESAIVITLFVLLAMGVVEFGRAFFVGNYIAHAARDGARMAAVLTYPNNRNTCQLITDFTPVSTQVQAELQAAGVTGLSVNFTQVPTPSTAPPCAQVPAGTIPYVTVTVSGPFNYMFNLPGVGTGFTVARTATFRDEQR